MRHANTNRTPQSIISGSLSTMTTESAMTPVFNEMLDVVTRLYNLTGQPDLKAIMDRAALVKR